MIEYRETHGFQTREEWNNFFTEYYEIIKAASQESISMPQNGISAELWVQEYQEHSAHIRRIWGQMEALLEQHIRYFTHDGSHWDEMTAKSLLSYLFRNCLETYCSAGSL